MSKIWLVFSGLRNLKKYQDESTKVSSVSTSLLADLLHFGHLQFTKLSM
jgi:hypothetical protein